MDKKELLKNQVVLVTGASSGIGAGIAKEMGGAGATVIVNYASSEEIRADVSDEAQVTDMFKKAIEQFGTIDVLVNNSGVQKDSEFVHMTLKQWQTVLGINLTGAFLCSREAAREFIRRGVTPERSKAAGKIIFVSSVHEVIPWAGHVNYAASKGGVMLLMKSIAQELAPHRIRVNSIGPGAIKTRINRAAWDTPEAEAELLRLIPYNRVGEPDDIGKVAVWLASDESDYITGTTVFADGGMLLYPGFATGG
jgi:glucose 1-dehydrogenase